MIVAGEAGIGKTALVRAFCQSIPLSPTESSEGACDPLFTPRPLGPFTRRRPGEAEASWPSSVEQWSRVPA